MVPTMPRFTVERARQQRGTRFPTAHAAVQRLGALGIVTGLTGQKKNRRDSDPPCIELMRL